MSLLSSKLIAINIVDVADGKFAAGNTSNVRDEKESRIKLLESQVEDLKQWRASLLADITAPRAIRSPPSTRSASPVRSDDLHSSETSASLYSSPKIKPVHNKPVLGQDTALKDVTPAGDNRSDTDIASRIMSIIQSYGQNEENETGDTWLGRFKFEPRVRKAVDAGIPVPLVLPAFPWKSVNKQEKVLGALPDLGEVLGLGRLNNLCEDIQQIYPPGARVTITSDGLVYNDLLGISDEEVFNYGAALRRIPGEQGYQNIDFIRIMNLLGLTDQATMTKEEYLETVGSTRDTLVEKFLDPTFIATDAIEEDRDINLTYCGYLKFLAKDLRHSPVTAGIVGKNEYRRVVKRVAQDMITRGKAFAAAIEYALPDHSALTESHDVVEKDGRPFYFRDRSDLWAWEGVDFDILYPKTLIVKARAVEGGEAPKLGKREMSKLKAFSKGFSPVITTGFAA
ncbi:putative pyoverdine dityrosine biosynthesis [Phaeomoniella chlamydospora]|uniref:Putative pyoverdine dityrosine biosynthesis n=1 Tax=Phaeomoniella chlamydospora TaxID=158046 RepID=A0A0G2E3P8_PHACM|nr:putative pyoverdine dityrosine biosynthesis [Phaeomoniella chlamydospora]